MVVAFATFSFQSFAQTFGVKAGLNMSKMTEMDDAKMLMGFHVGATAEFDVMENFTVETGLILSTKGVKFEKTVSQSLPGVGKFEATGTTKTNPMYLEIPINAKYGFDLGGKKLYVAAGPYLGFGIGGKDKKESDVKFTWDDGVSDAIKEMTKKTYENQTGSSDSKIEWGDKGMKRMDIGVNIGAGIEFGAIGVGIQYGLGLTEIAKDSKVKNRVIGISVSYKFAK